MERSKNRKPKEATCNICNRVFKSGYALTKHKEETGHKKWKRQTYSCYCGLVFDLRQEYRDHRKNCDIHLEKARWEARRGTRTMAKLSKTKEGRKLRSETLSKLWTDDAFREANIKRSSENAKKTSARPEIQAQRAIPLKKWRDEHPEEFAKNREKAHKAAKQSKAEIWAEPILKEYGFKRGGQVRCGKERKQVDFISSNCWIEFDGIWHFQEIGKRSRLETNNQRDRMLNNEALRRGICFIRIGMDCFASSTGAMKIDWIPIVFDLIKNKTKGVWMLGSLYKTEVWSKIDTNWRYIENAKDYKL